MSSRNLPLSSDRCQSNLLCSFPPPQLPQRRSPESETQIAAIDSEYPQKNQIKTRDWPKSNCFKGTPISRLPPPSSKKRPHNKTPLKRSPTFPRPKIKDAHAPQKGTSQKYTTPQRAKPPPHLTTVLVSSEAF